MSTHPMIFVNGHTLPAESACIPVQDRGFRYGDAVFETMAIRNGHAPLWPRHTARLLRACHALSIPAPEAAMLEKALRELCEINNCITGAARITITRGDGGHGYAPPTHATPRVIVQTMDQPKPTTLNLWLSSTRKPDPRHFPSNHKTVNALVSVLAMQEALANGCNDALILAADGTVCSTASGCMFWQDTNGAWHTPPLSSGALDGIARAIILESAAAKETITPLAQLQHATAVVSVNSVRGASPICALAPHGWQWHSQTVSPALHQPILHALSL